MKRNTILTILLFLINSNFSMAEDVITFNVSTGNDPKIVKQIGHPKDLLDDRHFSTLHEAIEASREWQSVTKRIVVYGGEYFVDETIEITGRQDIGLRILAAENTHPILYGGRIIEEWKEDGGTFYAADVPGVKEGSWDFRALVVNGELRNRARLPEDGTFEHESEFDVPWMSTTGGGWKRNPTREELTILKYKEKDIGSNVDPNNAEITVYHMWDESLVGVQSIDREKNIITFTNRAGHPPGAFGVQKYVIWNTREGMKKPGQWYLDRTRGKIVYWPLPGEDMKKSRVLAPTLEKIFHIHHTNKILLKGLRISVTNTPLVAGGFGAGRYDGAVHINNGSDIQLHQIEVFNTAGQGIRIDRAYGNRITESHIHDTGACGIKAPNSSVMNNHVHHVGRIYPSAIGVWGGGRGCNIQNNEIHHTPYSAINCGGENHRIENNRIYQAMLELHDGGAIYVFAGKNTILRGNFAYDIPDTGGYGSSAYYLDERSTDCNVVGNLSIGIQRPVHNHMAHGNTIDNNVFIYDGDMRLTFPKSTDYTFSNNVLVADGKITFENSGAITQWKGNVIHSKTGSIVLKKMRDYQATGESTNTLPENNYTKDPFITSYENGKVEYAKQSIIHELDIRPIDVSNAGISSNE